MRPYGSRKCNCNGKASRARAVTGDTQEIRRQLTGDEDDTCYAPGPCMCGGFYCYDHYGHYYNDWLMQQTEDWANCQCECCNFPGKVANPNRREAV